MTTEIKYTITLEGDFTFNGNFEEVVEFIKKNKINKKRNKKEYCLNTPTESNVVLYRSNEFEFLFD